MVNPGNAKSLQTLDFAGFFTLNQSYLIDFGGEKGIRTPGGFHLNGFQDRRIRPLCHLSGAKLALHCYPAKSILYQAVGSASMVNGHIESN